MKILKKIVDIIKFKIIPVISHPLSLLILGSFCFSSMIAKYNNISSANVAVANTGLIPAGKSYLNCMSNIKAAQDYYESVRAKILLAKNNFCLPLRNIMEEDSLERKIKVDCDNVYEILNFQAAILELETDLEKINKEREQRNYSMEVEKIKLDIKLSMLSDNLDDYNSMENCKNYQAVVVEQQFLESKRYIYEMRFYRQATGLFKEKIKENMNKKFWNFLF